MASEISLAASTSAGTMASGIGTSVRSTVSDRFFGRSRGVRACKSARAAAASLWYLIDTGVLSELGKRKRNPNLVAWFEAMVSTDLFV
jgi:hypothetical protein